MAIQKRVNASGKTRWIGRYRDLAGKERSSSFDTRKEAKAWVEEQQSAMRQGTWIDPASSKTTVDDLVSEYVKLTPHKGTQADREVLQANLGDLKDIPLAKLRASHIKNWAVQLRDGRPWMDGEPLSASTVKVKTGQLRALLNQAHRDGLCPRPLGDALKGFDPGAVAEFYMPKSAEVKKLYEWADGWFRLALRLGAEAGLRAGEVAGLRVKDVDFLRRVIHVRVQAKRGTGGKVTPLKSKTSRRDVPMSEDLALDLSTALIGRDTDPDDRLLLSKQGRDLYTTRVSRVMSNARKATGIDVRVHFHSLRHLYASRLLAAGVPLPTVSMLLGHANVQITAKVYSHHLPGQLESARAAVEALAGFMRDSEGEDVEGKANGV